MKVAAGAGTPPGKGGGLDTELVSLLKHILRPLLVHTPCPVLGYPETAGGASKYPSQVFGEGRIWLSKERDDVPGKEGM